ncbi:hypothetical protein CYG49_04460 [Candidatus Saccharibacteria bacterium]|nr:MAG: hypothetical protein CYG49_04460 [Candidatus Saccharibacteria bacterium]
MKEQGAPIEMQKAAEYERPMTGRIETLLHNAERSGVRAAMVVAKRDANDPDGNYRVVLQHGSDVRMHPASTIKVAIALYLAEAKLVELTSQQLTDEQAVDWHDFRDEDFVPGGGIFDQPDAPRSASYMRLIQDMLCDSRSGNMAAKLLVGRAGTEAFNEFWANKGAETIRLNAKGDWYEIERASAADLMKVLEEIPKLDNEQVSQQVASYIHLFMLCGSGSIGTVSGALERTSRMQLLTKTGKLPPDDEDPYHSRHDIGILDSSDGTSYAYVMMTQAPTLSGLIAAQEMIDGVGALLAHEAGLQTPSRTRRLLAVTALRTSGVMKRFKS